MDDAGVVIAESTRKDDAPGIAALAARTFPDACPSWLAPQHVQQFIANELSPAHFERWIAGDDAHVLVARDDAEARGYSLCLHGVHEEAPPARGGQRTAYLSKLYVDADHRGGAVAARLMAATIDAARDDGCTALWLGVNSENARAKRFYAKWGMTRVASREFVVGGHRFVDDVLGLTLER